MRRLPLLSVMTLLLAAGGQDTGISNEEYQQRRTTLLEKCGEGAVVVEAGRGSGQGMLDFYYLTGVKPANAILVLLTEDNQEFLFVEGDAKKIKKQTGIEHVLALTRFDKFVKDVLSAVDRFTVARRSGSRKTIEESNKDATFSSALSSHTAAMRQIKSEAEAKLLEKAGAITAAAHREAMKQCRPGMNEGELQKIIESTFKKEGGTGLGFPSIVGSGINGTVLHYQTNNQDMADGTLVVMDIGSQYKGYTADVTRTIPVSGKFDKEQREAYQCVLDAQGAAEKILKPGVTWRDLEMAARKVFEDRKLTEWSYAHSTTRNPSVRHGLGHFVGLHVHDVGSYGARLKPGMVVTIEPGYYNKDSKFGIRIEDFYLITEDGCKRLSKDAPREIDEIEKLMKSGK